MRTTVNLEMTPTPNSCRGFTLLEVMVALLVLSIGLLGLAALQTTALRANHEALMRTQATELAYDITDRMRANPVGVTAGDYVIDSATDVVIAKSCDAEDCTTAEMATFDLGQWKTTLALLPGGQGEVTQNAGPPLTHTVTIRWDENRSGATGTNCPPTGAADLRCFQMTL
jgi:type IV pilus assembly protein PilV